MPEDSSRGTPRLINTLCDNALFEGFVARAKDLDEKLIEKIARDLALEAAPAPEAFEPSGDGARRSRVDLAEIDRFLESLTK